MARAMANASTNPCCCSTSQGIRAASASSRESRTWITRAAASASCTTTRRRPLGRRAASQVRALERCRDSGTSVCSSPTKRISSSIALAAAKDSWTTICCSGFGRRSASSARTFERLAIMADRLCAPRRGSNSDCEPSRADPSTIRVSSMLVRANDNASCATAWRSGSGSRGARRASASDRCHSFLMARALVNASTSPRSSTNRGTKAASASSRES